MNLLDLVLLIMVAALAYWGLATGLVGAAIWFIAVYVSVVLGAQAVGRVVPVLGLPESWTAAVVPIGSLIFGIAVFWLAAMVATALKQTINVTPLKWVNRLGGAFFGAACGIVLAIAFIVMAAAFTYVVPEDSAGAGSLGYASGFAQGYLFDQPRRWLDEQLSNSSIVAMATMLRPLLIPFAPSEIGIAVDVLESRMS